jgi:hypothetical protein
MHSTINVTIAVNEHFNNIYGHLQGLKTMDTQFLSTDVENTIEHKFEIINQMIAKINESKKSLGF